MLGCHVFVHREPDIGRKRTRIVVRPGLLQQLNDSQWKLSWGKQQWLLSNTDVHMLSLGGTINAKQHGRLSISMKPADGGTLAEIAGNLFKDSVKKAA